MQLLLGFGVLGIVFSVLFFANSVLTKLVSKETKDKVLFMHGKE